MEQIASEGGGLWSIASQVPSDSIVLLDIGLGLMISIVPPNPYILQFYEIAT